MKQNSSDKKTKANSSLNREELKKQKDRQYLVKFLTEQDAKKRSEIFAKHGVIELEMIRKKELFLIYIPPEKDIKALALKLKEEKSVQYAEPNFQLSIMK